MAVSSTLPIAPPGILTLYSGQAVGAQLLCGLLICEQPYDFVGEILRIIRQQHFTIVCQIQPSILIEFATVGPA